ncbi:hypothetical protein ZYGR_0AD00840 [Zygosaccharomyces rouxii]|uniref:Proteasome component ECM29 n=1 Tax=Zygosaccharomyces rouxii TaxID=4956 RepID=A0A1Q3A5H8_ZYGRO|nr:hypothetical protein ZYGR_0AD00840 [Zygosaccharomyces rouxii]
MSSVTSEVKEKELVEKVELRLALSDTPDKFEQNLDTFLPPLLLKLGSPHASVRQAVFNSLRDVLARLNSLTNVRLPVEKLLLQSQKPPFTQESNNVRLYSLLLASKGIDRLEVGEKRQLIPVAMREISKLPDAAAARVFHIVCKLITSWVPPQRSSKEEDEAFESLKLEDRGDLEFLAQKFTQFFFLIPAKADPQTKIIPRGYTCPGLCADEVSFFTYTAGVTFTKEQMVHFKSSIFKFFNSGFTQDTKLLAKFLIVASTDSSDISDTAAFYLKKLNISSEDPDFVDFLISLYTGDKSVGKPPVRPELQDKILSFLNKSVYATSNAKKVSQICHIGLHSSLYRLRSSCLTFVRHVAQHNYKNLIEQPGENEGIGFNVNIASLIRNNLHSEGWPRLQLSSSTPNFANTILQRRLQYETLGDILSRDFDLLKDLSFIEFLFDSLRGDFSEFLPSIQEALTSLTGSLSQLPAASKEKLREIIRKHLSDDFELESSENKETKDSLMACRFILIKYANATFEFDDSEARLFNIWGTSRANRFDIIEESNKGLDPYWFRMNRASDTKEFKSTSELLSSRISETMLPSFPEFVATLLKENDLKSLTVTSVIRGTLGTAVRFAKQCLISQAVRGKSTCVVQDEDWSLRIEKALDVDDKVSSLALNLISGFDGEWFTGFLRLLCGEIIQKNESGRHISTAKYPDAIYGELLLILLRNCSDKTLGALEDLIPAFYNFLGTIQTANDLDIVSGANLLGIISASVPNSPHLKTIVDQRIETSPGGEIGASLIADSYIFPRLYLRGHFKLVGNERLGALVSNLLSLISNPKLKLLSGKLLCEVSKFGLLRELDSQARHDTLNRLIDLLGSKLLKDEAYVEIWGTFSLYSREFGLFEEFFNKLYDTHVSKQIELIFAVGESLSILAGGWKSSFLLKQLDVSRTALVPLQNSFGDENVGIVLDKVLNACDSTKPSLRKSACIWLLSLLQYLKSTTEISSRCNEIHLRFMKFLVDKDEFVQDSASRGLSLVYEIGNGDLQESMIKSLLKSFTDSANAMNMSSGTVSADTQLFDEGMLNTGDGSVSTYKDILNLASEVGDPALVYKFMSLAKSSSLWASRKGIAFGLGAIMSKSSLENLLLEDRGTAEKLIPKLYRYRFDPYQSVSRSMNDIWNTLISNSNSVISEYFDEILKELLAGMGNKEWRVREASTLALLQLVQGQGREQLDDKLLDIWFMAFRSMDDIKESVREAGIRLTTVLAKILARAVDVNKGVKPEKSRHILESILPFLLGTRGLNSDAEDVRNFSLKTIVDLIKNSGSAMKPFAVELVHEFILLFSSIEPQIVNFLSLNASNYKVDANTIDMHRKTTVTNSPLLEAIDKLITNSDDSLIDSHVNSVTKAIKKSVGLPSKVAASTVVNILVRRYSFSLTPYSGRLLKVCVNQFDDRNESVRLTFALSFGHVYHVASLEKCVKYAEQLSERYFTSNESISRKVVGSAVEAVSKYANKQFEDVSGIYVPLLFIASNDADEVVGTFFSKVWTETSTSGTGAMKLYLKETVDLLQKYIGSKDFAMRRTCAKSVSLLCEKVDLTVKEETVQQLFEITIESLKGRTWEGKEVIVEALVSLAVKFHVYVNSHSELSESLQDVLTAELGRQNKRYTKQIIFSYCRFMEVFPQPSMVDKLIQVAQTFFEDGAEDGDSSNKRSKPYSEISLKSSPKNVELEDYSIKLLKSCAKICRPVNDVYPYSLFHFIVSKILFLLQEDFVIYTWRTQVGACEIGSEIMETYNEKFVAVEFEESLRKLWNELFIRNSTRETVDNAKIQLVRFGSKISTKDAYLRNEIQRDLINLSETDVSAKVSNELKNLGIND